MRSRRARTIGALRTDPDRRARAASVAACGPRASSSAPGGPTGGALPFTGASTLALLAVGIALAGLGGVTLSAGSRRRRA